MKTKQCDVLGSMFEIYDIGYSRSSKAEWMNFFASAKAVVFVVDLTNFDQTVTGDKKGKNKMVGFSLIRPLFFCRSCIPYSSLLPVCFLTFLLFPLTAFPGRIDRAFRQYLQQPYHQEYHDYPTTEQDRFVRT